MPTRPLALSPTFEPPTSQRRAWLGIPEKAANSPHFLPSSQWPCKLDTAAAKPPIPNPIPTPSSSPSPSPNSSLNPIPIAGAPGHVCVACVCLTWSSSQNKRRKRMGNEWGWGWGSERADWSGHGLMIPRTLIYICIDTWSPPFPKKKKKKSRANSAFHAVCCLPIARICPCHCFTSCPLSRPLLRPPARKSESKRRKIEGKSIRQQEVEFGLATTNTHEY